jgi:hypothetical protein
MMLLIKQEFDCLNADQINLKCIRYPLRMEEVLLFDVVEVDYKDNPNPDPKWDDQHQHQAI